MVVRRISRVCVSGIFFGSSIASAQSTAIVSQNSPVVDALMRITLLGSEWVLWLLIGLSIWSLAVILERTSYFWKDRLIFDDFLADMTKYFQRVDTGGARLLCEKTPGFESRVAYEGLVCKDSISAEQGIASYIAQERNRMDKGLSFLGTLGNNAPFIGLFGTVLGIIQAFDSLSQNPQGGPAVVMAGISEALIATAVGLFVALPAVIAFNSFQAKIAKRLTNADAIQGLVLKYLKSNPQAGKDR